MRVSTAPSSPHRCPGANPVARPERYVIQIIPTEVPPAVRASEPLWIKIRRVFPVGWVAMDGPRVDQDLSALQDRVAPEDAGLGRAMRHQKWKARVQP